MCIILKKEVQSSVQHPPYTQAVPIPAAVGIFREVPWFKGSVYKMQLLCPVTEGSQLPQTQRISSVLSLQRGCMAPSELLLPSRCTLLRRNWILVHSKSPAVVWNSKPTVLWALHRISLHGEWSELDEWNQKQSTTQELQKLLQFKTGICLMP